jgi:putative addiction module CopG family antidote
MEIALKPDLETYVREKINEGQFGDASEVVNAALSAFKAQEGLRRALEAGLQQLARGQSGPWSSEEIKSEGRRILADRRRRGA